MSKVFALCNRGYSILKKEWTAQELATIKKELTVLPITMHTLNNNNNSELEYYVFRESEKKLYMPQFYGRQKFGAPTVVTLSSGDSCVNDMTFAGTLRDYQVPVIEKFLTYLSSSDVNGGGGLLQLPCGWGKTSGALYISSILKKKTLVIGHMDFLLNQWTERIHQFLPGAKIGRIQQDVIDVEDKDIVLCMLQSLVRRDYPPALFAQFGLTIIDEVHHISSQTFSTVLFKVVTKYMLGLSATMERKDGTTRVFKWFLGEIIQKVESRSEQPVEVRAVTFVEDADAEFNETIVDYQGKPQHSSMISKLCNYPKRTEFIIAQICDFLKNHAAGTPATTPLISCAKCQRNIHYLVKNTCCGVIKYCLVCSTSAQEKKCPDCKKKRKFEQNYIDNGQNIPKSQRHVIVMAHNLSLLHYIYDKMVCFNLAEVGFYVGGMKEVELKKSEKRQVILATFSMTQEGLDIPSLNTEFLITPKTDIIQSVGRILRTNHADFPPIIYDFVDTHDIFRRQWAKRKAFFRKNNYLIKGARKSSDDSNELTNWKILFDPVVSSAVLKKRTINDVDDDYDDDDDDDNKIIYEDNINIFNGFKKMH